MQAVNALIGPEDHSNRITITAHLQTDQDISISA